MTEKPTPSLEQCVEALLKKPDHPRATAYAWALMFAMDLRVMHGRLTKAKRDEYYHLLGELLFPLPNGDA
jgi:hypothetical protein